MLNGNWSIWRRIVFISFLLCFFFFFFFQYSNKDHWNLLFVFRFFTCVFVNCFHTFNAIILRNWLTHVHLKTIFVIVRSANVAAFVCTNTFLILIGDYFMGRPCSLETIGHSSSMHVLQCHCTAIHSLILSHWKHFWAIHDECL